MKHKSASLATRLAALIDGVDEEQLVPNEAILCTPARTMLQVSHTLAAQALEPPEVGISTLSLAAQSAGWTIPVLEQFAQCLLNDPSIIAVQHPGVTRVRVRGLLPEHLKAHDEHPAALA